MASFFRAQEFHKASRNFHAKFHAEEREGTLFEGRMEIRKPLIEKCLRLHNEIRWREI